MFCVKCGKKLADDARFCTGCGTAVAAKTEAAPVEEVVAAPAAEPVVVAAPVEEVVVAPVVEQPAVDPVAYTSWAETAPIRETPATEVLVASEPEDLNQTEMLIQNESAEDPCETEVLEEPKEQIWAAPQAEPTPSWAEPQAEAFAPVSFEAPKKKKKKVNVLAWLIPVVAVVAAAAVAVALFFDQITAFYMSNIASPEDYLQYVETQSFEKTAKDISKFYGLYKEQMQVTDRAAEASIKLNLSDTVLEMLQLAAGEEMDLAWINDTSVDVEVNAKGGKQKVDLTLKKDGSELFNVVGVLDMEGQEVYVGVPSLSEAYLFGEFAGTDMAMATFNPLEMYGDLAKALPSEEVLEQLLVKYYGLILQNLDDVEKSKQTLTVEGISQEVTVLKCTIDEKTAVEKAKVVLAEAKTDAELKKLVEAFADFASDYGAEDVEDAYEMFQEAIDEALETLEEDEADSEETLCITSFVDKDHQVVGRIFSFADEEMLRYITLTDGDQFATEFITEALEVTGKGTRENNVENAEYALVIEGEEFLILQTEKFEVNSMEEKGCLNGKFVLIPGEYLYESMNNSMIESFAPALFVEMSGDRNESKMILGISSNGVELGSVQIEGEFKKPSKIDLPNHGLLINLDNEDALEQWLATVEYEKMESLLTEIGMEDFLTELYPPEEPEYYPDEPNPVIAAFVEANREELLTAMESSFATSSGLTCTSDIWVEGNGFVIQININEFDDIDEETKQYLQETYDSMNDVFQSSLEQMQYELPEMEYFMVWVCEVDGDPLAYILAQEDIYM